MSLSFLTHLLTHNTVVSEFNPHDETGGTSLTISLPAGSKLLSDVHLGDSIAINGVCLTVTSFASNLQSFKVGVAPETLRVTNLGTLRRASRVNLERAVRTDTRMGGHFVQGHVDTTATIVSVKADGNALTMRFKPAKLEALRYIVHKGFIALDGTSLTITAVDDEQGWWEVMLIAYTQERVVLAQKKAGDSVNIEVDMMAKYAEKSIAGYFGGKDGADGSMPMLERVVERVVAKYVGVAAGEQIAQLIAQGQGARA